MFENNINYSMLNNTLIDRISGTHFAKPRERAPSLPHGVPVRRVKVADEESVRCKVSRKSPGQVPGGISEPVDGR
jgi:hypothetical protein